MNKIFLLGVFLISFSFILLIPSVQAGITFQPRVWQEVCSHEIMVNETDYPYCRDDEKPDITDHLTITWNEDTSDGKRWKFNLVPKDSLFDNYTLEDFENMKDTVRNVTSGLKIIYKKRIWKKSFVATEGHFVIDIRTLRNIRRQGNCIEMTEFDGYFSAIGDEANYSNKFLGFSANVSLSAGWLAYGSTNLTSSDFSYLATKTIGGKTFNHIYYKKFPVIPNGTEKDFLFRVCFNSKPKFAVLYFGSASSAVKIDDDISNGMEIGIEFKDGWKVGEKFKFGYKTMTYASSTNVITILGDDTCGLTEADGCSIDDIYNADKAGTLVLMENQTGAGMMNLSFQMRPADNVTIPVVFNVTNMHLSNLNDCNITGTISNSSTIIENVNFTDNTTYTTVNYWSSLENSTINCSSTASVQIYQNQWGSIWKTSDTQFKVDQTGFIIGNNSKTVHTWWVDTTKQILFSGNCRKVGSAIFSLTNNSHIVWGQLDSAVFKTTSEGMQIIVEDTISAGRFIIGGRDGSSVDFFGCSFTYESTSYYWFDIMTYPSGTFPVRIYNCIMNRFSFGRNRDFDIYNSYVLRALYGFNLVTDVAGTFDRIGVSNVLYGLGWNSATDKTFYNFYARGVAATIRWLSETSNLYLINPDVDTWTIAWHYSPFGTIYRQYEFDLNVTDEAGNPINGAEIDINSTSTFENCSISNNYTTTDAGGRIETQIVTMGYYNTTIDRDNQTIHDCNPYVFKIAKAGYQTLNFTANITEKTDWTLALIEGITQLTLIKNIQYSGGNSTHVNYTITDQVINTGTINISNIAFQDSDISALFFIDNLEVNETNTTSGIVTVAKAMNNQEETFVAATATVGITFYSSNQPSVLIPGTGGPADVNVSVPSSVAVGGAIEGTININNTNPDIGQDFTVDYMITSLDEALTYSSGQKTVYVGASSTVSTSGPLTAPSQAGAYKYKTIVYWIGGSANASASFTAVSPEAPAVIGGGGFVGIVGKAIIEIVEYPVEMVVEQGGVEFYSLLVKNTGTASLHNVAITLDEIPQEWYLLIPENVRKIDAKDERNFILKIILPSDVEQGIYSTLINATSNENSTSVVSKLRIVPIVFEPLRVFDAQVTTTFNTLYKNEEGQITIFIENVGNENITATASLILPEGMSTRDEYVTKTIGPKSNTTLEFNVLPTIEGIYNVTLVVKHGWEQFSKNIFIEIEEMEKAQILPFLFPIGLVVPLFLGILVLIVFVSILYLTGRHYLKKKNKGKKRKKKRIKK